MFCTFEFFCVYVCIAIYRKMINTQRLQNQQKINRDDLSSSRALNKTEMQTTQKIRFIRNSESYLELR